MVVGDRLWLFSQTPHAAPTPIQSLLLNGGPTSVNHPGMLQNHPAVLPRQFFQQSPPQLNPRLNQGFNLNPQSSYVAKNLQQNFLHKTAIPSYSRPTPDEIAAMKFDQCRIKYEEDQGINYKLNHLKGSAESNGGLADLERAFGNNSSILTNNEVTKFNENIASDLKSCSSSSDVDCEEMDENEELKI